MDFSKILIPCSALPTIMAASKENKGLTDKQTEEYNKLLNKTDLTDKQRATLEMYEERLQNKGSVNTISGSAISKLRDIYIRAKWGKEQVSVAKDYIPAALNGTMSERNSIKLISDFDGIEYKLHKKLISNRYITGVLDCYLGKSAKKASKVIDVKTASSMHSLLSLVRDEEERSRYYWQIMGYLAITGADTGEVCHCLVTYPERIINDEINKFLNKVKGIGVPGEYIEREIHKIRSNMTFDEIPVSQRIVRFKVERDEDSIAKIYDRVKFCRKWLTEFDNSISNMNLR